MATKRSGTALLAPKAKKMPKPAYEVRKQVLSLDSLLDVFSYVDRHTLDDANVVSFDYNATAQHVPALRIVKDAHFYHDPEDQTFHVTVYYNLTTEGDTKNERKALRKVAKNMEEAVLVFFRSLSFCNVSRRIRLFGIEIQQLFVDQLKAVAKQFLCKDEKLDFVDVTLADGVDAFDLLLAFPSFKALNDSTFNLVEDSVGSSDELLKAAASRGAFYLFYDGHLANSRISEATIVDYMFGDYDDHGAVRKLDVNWPAVSRKFLVNLVRACRDCRSVLKIDLTISMINEDLHLDELAANGEKHSNDDGVSYTWRFRFDDLPDVIIEYMPPHHPQPRFRHSGNAEFRCRGTIHGRRTC